MPYLTLTENLKLQQRPGLVASNDIQEMEWVYSGTNTHNNNNNRVTAISEHDYPHQYHNHSHF